MKRKEKITGTNIPRPTIRPKPPEYIYINSKPKPWQCKYHTMCGFCELKRAPCDMEKQGAEDDNSTAD